MDEATQILGPQCPHCGWRYEFQGHRPKIGDLMDACPQWTPPPGN